MSPYEDHELCMWFERNHKQLYERIVNLEQQPAGSKDPYRVTWLEQRIGILEGRIADLEGQRDKRAFSEHEVKSQAAQHQAQGRLTKTETVSAGGLYAPLRSDTKPLLEMSAFVRKVANADPEHSTYSMYTVMRAFVAEAQDILKRST